MPYKIVLLDTFCSCPRVPPHNMPSCYAKLAAQLPAVVPSATSPPAATNRAATKKPKKGKKTKKAHSHPTACTCPIVGPNNLPYCQAKVAVTSVPSPATDEGRTKNRETPRLPTTLGGILEALQFPTFAPTPLSPTEAEKYNAVLGRLLKTPPSPGLLSSAIEDPAARRAMAGISLLLSLLPDEPEVAGTPVQVALMRAASAAFPDRMAAALVESFPREVGLLLPDFGCATNKNKSDGGGMMACLACGCETCFEARMATIGVIVASVWHRRTMDWLESLSKPGPSKTKM